MVSIITEVGQDWVVDRLLNGDDTSAQEDIVVGTGTTGPVGSDVSLENEVYRASINDTNANIYSVDSPGIYRADITVTGGVEVPPGTDVTEFGIETTNGDLIYREVRSATSVENGERISFEFEVEFLNA